MRKLIVTILLLFVNIIVFGQNNYENIITGSVFKDEVKWSRVIFSESDGNDGVVLVRTVQKKASKPADSYLVEHYGADLKLIKRSKIDNASSNIVIDNGIINIILFDEKNKASGYEFSVLSAPISSMDFKKKSLCSVGKEEKLGVALYAMPKSYDPAAFGTVFFSENKNFIALSFDIKNDDVATHKIVVFNKKFEKVKEYLFKKNIKDDFFVFQNVSLNDIDGTVYLLGKIFENNSRATKKDDKINYHFESYKLNDKDYETIVLKNDNNLIKSLNSVTKNNKLSYVGLYGKNKESKSSGVCRYLINIEKFELLNSSFNKFSNQFIIDKYGKSSDKELKDILLSNAYMEDNGDIIITGEEYYVEYGKDYPIYCFDDIISAKIDNKGKLIWARNINKNQKAVLPSYTSYVSVYTNNKIYFFFNASRKIKESKNGSVEFLKFKSDDSAIYSVSIDENGKTNHKNIYQNKDSDVLFHFNNFVTTKEDNIILFGNYGTEKQLIKIEK
ncbi:hypothetical protein HSX10_14970 [Winogradskyella undariae]|uniref:hypothetical protein n=1 Tax=Winogradskyella TaxID=286104 RepID=UPI00156BA6E5|nr:MULTISPECIES: hypothetical protein [Winogradskyella]NRR92874.1 hypothetical protein [Winogradskyella undariae]QXP79166.1 hypothetical protein H0I32_00495 [Winogradskyella sp. HaHa_3_26]